MKEGCVEWATCGVEACTISISPRCRLPSTSSASLQRALAGIQCCRRILGRESLRASSSSVAAVAQSFFGKAEDHWRSGRFADSTSADVHLRQIRVKYCKWFKLGKMWTVEATLASLRKHVAHAWLGWMTEILGETRFKRENKVALYSLCSIQPILWFQYLVSAFQSERTL